MEEPGKGGLVVVGQPALRIPFFLLLGPLRALMLLPWFLLVWKCSVLPPEDLSHPGNDERPGDDERPLGSLDGHSLIIIVGSSLLLLNGRTTEETRL